MKTATTIWITTRSNIKIDTINKTFELMTKQFFNGFDFESLLKNLTGEILKIFEISIFVYAFLKQYHVKDGLILLYEFYQRMANELAWLEDVKVVILKDITIRFCQSASTDVWGKGVSAKK